jgi:antitoxin component HigA of HigAB toxin-antitoxin module
MEGPKVGIELINSGAAYQRALKRLAGFFDHPPCRGTAGDADFKALMLVVGKYEDQHCQVPAPDQPS